MSLKNSIITVIAEKIVFPGRSLCRCTDGLALFTEGLLPQEKAEVLVIRDKKSFREGILKNIIEKAPTRIEPICLSFGRCGGCTFQNTDYESQIKYKQEYLKELLGFANVDILPILKSPQVWNYRNKMEFSFFNNDGKVDLGLHCRGSFNRYVSVPPCFIADKDFCEIAQITKDFANKNNLSAYNNRTHEGFFRHLVLRKAQNNDELLINIVTNVDESKENLLLSLSSDLEKFAQSIFWTQNGKQSDAVKVDKIKLLFGKENITEKLNVCQKDYFFNISPFSFFQTNSKGTQILYNEVAKLLNPKKDDVLLDLYCGTGSIGISLSGKVKKIIGIEQVEQAIDDAKANALLNNVENTKFQALTVQEWVKDTNNKEEFNLVVIDPPRSGLTNDVIEFLLNSKAEKIIYVSCNPSTLARDLAIILEEGKFKVGAIVPVDMFPQTYHIETIVSLERNK